MKKLAITVLAIIILIFCGCSADEKFTSAEHPDSIEMSNNHDIITEKLIANYNISRVFDALDRSIGEWEVGELSYRVMYGLGEDGDDPEKEVVGKTIRIDNQYRVYFENVELVVINAREVDAGVLYAEERMFHGQDASEITRGGKMLSLNFDNNAGIEARFGLLVSVEFDEIYLVGTEGLNIGGAYKLERKEFIVKE